MLRLVILLSLASFQATASNVAEVVPAAVIASRSSQYFAQNHNAFSSPLVIPSQPAALAAAKLETVAPVAARLENFAPVARTYSSSGTSVSQVIRVAPFIAQYVSAPLVASPFLIANAPLDVPARRISANQPAALPAGSVLVNSPVAAPPALQPETAPAFQPAVNPDSESIDIESARLRSAPQQQRSSQAKAQENLAGMQQQIGIKSAGQQTQNGQLNAARGQPSNQLQQQRSAAPGLLSNEQFAPRGYYN